MEEGNVEQKCPIMGHQHRARMKDPAMKTAWGISTEQQQQTEKRACMHGMIRRHKRQDCCQKRALTRKEQEEGGGLQQVKSEKPHHSICAHSI